MYLTWHRWLSYFDRSESSKLTEPVFCNQKKKKLFCNLCCNISSVWTSLARPLRLQWISLWHIILYRIGFRVLSSAKSLQLIHQGLVNICQCWWVLFKKTCCTKILWFCRCRWFEKQLQNFYKIGDICNLNLPYLT